MPTPKQQRSKQAFADGVRQEFLAALMLRAKLYSVLGTRLRTPFGEVDILAAKNGALIIVEVKSRNSVSASAEAISPQQRERLIRAAQYLAPRYKFDNATIRMDAFLFAPKQFPQHIKNAFGLK
jgi:putative endonuclease